MLLDTNALIWAQQGSPQLGRKALQKIQQATVLYFSPISVLEIELKSMRQKILGVQNFYSNLLEDGFTEIRLSGQHAQGIREFANLVQHDPFDRVLLATAAKENLKFVTSDRKILQLGLPFVIDAQE